MTCATGLRGVVDQGAARATEFVVECDCGGECGESGAEANAEVMQGASAVALGREDVLRGPKDRFDPLADWREVRAASFLVFASGTQDRSFELRELGFEVLAAEVLIADQDDRSSWLAFAAGDHLQADELLVDLRRGQRQCPGGAVRREQGVQSKSPEVAAVAGAGNVVGGGREGGAPNRR